MLIGDRCKHCGMVATETIASYAPVAVDPCLGLLPGVIWACCGHGGRNRPYAVISSAPPCTDMRMINAIDPDYLSLEYEAATKFFELVKAKPKG